MIDLDVVGFRLVEPEDTPVLLLQDSGGTRVLPIWISSLDAAAIAVVLEDESAAPRPMTHDLLASALREMAGDDEGRAVITEMNDGIYFARLEVGDASFDCRPSDAVAVALRLEWPIGCSEQLMDQVGVEVAEADTDEVQRFREFLDTVNPDDFES
ncbi:MAG: bifunctional nuclease family protein [Arachnia sp.]